MSVDLSQYARNKPLIDTANSYALMGELGYDTLARASAVVGSDIMFTTVLSNLREAVQAYREGEICISMAETNLPVTTLALADKLADLRRKANVDSNSLLETWDSKIRVVVAYQGLTYNQLLPQGRETLTSGSRKEQIDAIEEFGMRLSNQLGKPALIALAQEVSDFSNELRELRAAQTEAKSAVETSYLNQEALRVKCAAAIYALLGQGMVKWCDQPEKVDSLWNVNLLRKTALQVPEAPLDTTWNGPTRTLSTTKLPKYATRLEAWRKGPGGMPELLVSANSGSLSLTIPTSITFTPGNRYQIWLVAANSRGRSELGPVQEWVAP